MEWDKPNKSILNRVFCKPVNFQTIYRMFRFIQLRPPNLATPWWTRKLNTYRYTNVWFSVVKIYVCSSGFELTFQSCIVKNYITVNREHDWTPIKYVNTLHLNRTQKQMWHFFLKILQKHYQLLFWVVWICLTTSGKNDNPNL